MDSLTTPKHSFHIARFDLACTRGQLDDLEPFYPERMASRILGMGDVVTLVEKAQKEASNTDREGSKRRKPLPLILVGELQEDNQ